MQSAPRPIPETIMYRSLAALAAGLLILGSAQAQEKPKIVKEDVSFKTYDGVLIKGTFYPSQKGGNAPVVMFLHKMLGKRTDEGWEGLAGVLQQKGYAVLAFDFRGHGASTTIDNPMTFWSMAHNQTYLRKPDSQGKKNKLEASDFRLGYLPYLVNDIVAARHDLDNRNDNGQCNTSNIIVIGAEEGATLGFFWTVTEFYRDQVWIKQNLLQFGGGVLNNSPAGDDIAGAIWLSYRKGIGSTPAQAVGVPNHTWGQYPVINVMRDRIPMWFAAGAQDKAGVDDAKYMYDNILHAEKKKEKLDLTSNLTVAGTKLRGVALLGKENLNTDDLIEKFIEKAVKRRGGNQAPKKRNAGDFKPGWIVPSAWGFSQ